MRALTKHPKPISTLAARCGKMLFTMRRDRGWSQRKVANKARLSLAFLCDVENGKRRIGAEKLYRIARVFGVSMDEFFKR